MYQQQLTMLATVEGCMEINCVDPGKNIGYLDKKFCIYKWLTNTHNQDVTKKQGIKIY